MRTKAILCAASLAAGALTSMAQVYSQNIVGYVNVTLGGGYTYMSNPLDSSPNNFATNVFPNVGSNTGSYDGPFDGANVQYWTGGGFKIYYFDSETSETTTGFANAPAGGSPLATPNMASGVGFLFNVGGATATTQTFVGQVRTGTSTVVIPGSGALFSLGSPTPIAGGPLSNLGFANPDPTQDYSGPLDGAVIQTLKTTAGGAFLGYSLYYFDSVTSDTTTGFADAPAGGNQRPEPQIPLAGGFLMGNGTGNAYNWTQTLNP